MKEKFLFLFLIISATLFSQQKKYTIKWNGLQTISAGNYSLEIPSFNTENFSFDFDEGLQFISQWKISNTVNKASVKISNIVYTSISKNELKDLKLSQIPRKLKFSLKNSKGRNKQFAYFKLSPIIKDVNGNYKKVLSFQINYNTSASKNSLVNKGNYSQVISNSVLSSGDWYKFYVDTTGVFKISKSFLNGLGVNVNSVDPRTIKLYGNGGRMIPYSNAEPYPFDVEENAIKVVGEEDGVFNNEDYILFYAQGPKEYNVESNTNINCYTDKTYYFINISSGIGKRIQPFVQPKQ